MLLIFCLVKIFIIRAIGIGSLDVDTPKRLAVQQAADSCGRFNVPRFDADTRYAQCPYVLVLRNSGSHSDTEVAVAELVFFFY